MGTLHLAASLVLLDKIGSLHIHCSQSHHNLQDLQIHTSMTSTYRYTSPYNVARRNGVKIKMCASVRSKAKMHKESALLHTLKQTHTDRHKHTQGHKHTQTQTQTHTDTHTDTNTQYLKK